MTEFEQLQAKYAELLQHYQIVCEELDELRRRYEPVPYAPPRDPDVSSCDSYIPSCDPYTLSCDPYILSCDTNENDN